MTPTLRMLMARLAVVLVAAAACLLAWRSGGGAEGATPPPRAEELDSGAEAAATASAVLPPPLPGGQGYEVALRLVEIFVFGTFEQIGQARVGAHLVHQAVHLGHRRSACVVALARHHRGAVPAGHRLQVAEVVQARPGALQFVVSNRHGSTPHRQGVNCPGKTQSIKAVIVT